MCRGRRVVDCIFIGDHSVHEVVRFPFELRWRGLERSMGRTCLPVRRKRGLRRRLRLGGLRGVAELGRDEAAQVRVDGEPVLVCTVLKPPRVWLRDA
jgi:hypothetical protein